VLARVMNSSALTFEPSIVIPYTEKELPMRK
jgi:hypothetical protein